MTETGMFNENSFLEIDEETARRYKAAGEFLNSDDVMKVINGADPGTDSAEGVRLFALVRSGLDPEDLTADEVAQIEMMYGNDWMDKL